MDISTHALVQRAAEQAGQQIVKELISTHALVQRAALSDISIIPYQHYFNPRPRAEGGHCRGECRNLRGYFNPRPRAEGGDYTTARVAVH